MSERRPDFKNMTPDDIRSGISKLNTQIGDLRKKMNLAAGKMLIGQTLAMGAVIPAAMVFPPLAAGVAAAGMLHGVEKSTEGAILRREFNKAVELRQKYKTVWRARPGRTFYDVDKRIQRENDRRAEKQRKKIIKQYGWRFGIE